MALTNPFAEFREHPIAVSLEVGSLIVCFGLVGALVVAISRGPPTGWDPLWVGIVVVGTMFVLLWTVVVPLYERYVLSS